MMIFEIYDGREKFYQWDTSRKLIVNDKTISEVHFANCLCAEARKCEPYAIGELLVVDVPNDLLTEYQDIRVWGYDSGMTKHDAVFEVEKRTKPADYIYTPEELKTWEQLDAKIDTEINNLKAFIQDYGNRITAIEEQLKPDIQFSITLNDGNKITYTVKEGTTWRQFQDTQGIPAPVTTCSTCSRAYTASWPGSTITAKLQCSNSHITTYTLRDSDGYIIPYSQVIKADANYNFVKNA